MEKENLPITNHAKTFGVVFGGYSILILVLVYLFNYETNTGISMLFGYKTWLSHRRYWWLDLWHLQLLSL